MLKTITSKLLECKSDEVHDYVLSIFDELDEINRDLYKYLLKEKYLENEKTSAKGKSILYEKLDIKFDGNIEELCNELIRELNGVDTSNIIFQSANVEGIPS